MKKVQYLRASDLIEVLSEASPDCIVMASETKRNVYSTIVSAFRYKGFGGERVILITEPPRDILKEAKKCRFRRRIKAFFRIILQH